MARSCRVLSAPLFLAILMLLIPAATAGAAWAACSGEPPPLPPEGLSWPLTGEVTGDWTLDCRTGRGHRGIDIAAIAGAAVGATASGKVSFVGFTPAEDGGLTITIDHEGGLRSSYLHLAEAAVSKGDTVTAGQKIAVSTGTPLHFGIRLPGGSERYFNPIDLLPPLEPPTEITGTGAPVLAPQTTGGMITSEPPLPSPEPVPATGDLPAAEIIPAPAAVRMPAVAPDPGYSTIPADSQADAAEAASLNINTALEPEPPVENSLQQPAGAGIPSGFRLGQTPVSRLAPASPLPRVSAAPLDRRRLLPGGLALTLSSMAAAAAAAGRRLPTPRKQGVLGTGSG